MKERAAPDYGSIDGLKKLYFLRRIDGDTAHFLLVTLWDSMESVSKFAGEKMSFANLIKLSKILTLGYSCEGHS
jgi:hypothetical protein